MFVLVRHDHLLTHARIEAAEYVFGRVDKF
jgi:hypothetical protein